MSMKVSVFNGQPAIYVRYRTRKPKAGEHFNLYETDDPIPNKYPVERLILKECLHSKKNEIDKNQIEEWWSFDSVSEFEFHRMRHAARHSEIIEKTHDRLF